MSRVISQPFESCQAIPGRALMFSVTSSPSLTFDVFGKRGKLALRSKSSSPTASSSGIALLALHLDAIIVHTFKPQTHLLTRTTRVFEGN